MSLHELVLIKVIVFVIFVVSAVMSVSSSRIILRSQRITSGPMPTPDPFLFCVYHLDKYPKGPSDKSMEAPRRGDGMDFNPTAPYRMYHGDKVPGFPQHPHRGFETITATLSGLIDHADSVGNAGRYGEGDLQWMTAGKGVVHGEMFPLVNIDRPNHTKFFQIWLNLPRKSKMVEPSFAMFWANDISKFTSNDGKAVVTSWYGDYFVDPIPSKNKPPENSWASDPYNDVAVLHIMIQPGGKIILPKSRERGVNRSLYLVEVSNPGVIIGGNSIKQKVVLDINSDVDIELELPTSAAVACEIMLLQGRPINEPVEQHGPFVMNTRDEISQAFSDYSKTKFGGWPWPRDDMIFSQDKGRFALLYGKETIPNSETCSPNQKKI